MSFGYLNGQPYQVVLRGVDANGDLMAPADGIVVDQATRRPGEDATLDKVHVIPSMEKIILSATGIVCIGSGYFGGVIVGASTSGTLILHDNASAASGDIIFPDVALTKGDIRTSNWGIPFSNGLYATVANTLTVTILFAKAA